MLPLLRKKNLPVTTMVPLVRQETNSKMCRNYGWKIWRLRGEGTPSPGPDGAIAIRVALCSALGHSFQRWAWKGTSCPPEVVLIVVSVTWTQRPSPAFKGFIHSPQAPLLEDWLWPDCCVYSFGKAARSWVRYKNIQGKTVTHNWGVRGDTLNVMWF